MDSPSAVRIPFWEVVESNYIESFFNNEQDAKPQITVRDLYIVI